MNNIKKLTTLLIVLIAIILGNVVTTSIVSAAGISIDAGLTPAEHRWMVRSQMRYMTRDNHPIDQSREMKMQMYPVVVAYGLRSDVTLMARQIIRRTEMTMMGNTTTNSGLTDLFLMTKYRLVRINDPKYTLGIAPTLGLDLPTGQDGFSSNSLDLRLGCFVSGRLRSLGFDLNLAYMLNSMIHTGVGDKDLGDEITVESAFAYQFPIGSGGRYAVAPVIEASYKNATANKINDIELSDTGESFFLVSPGLKATRGSFIFETLIQFPVWQDQNGNQTERTPTYLIGFRLMN